MLTGFWVIEFDVFQSDPNINSDPISFYRARYLCNCILAQLCLTYIAIYFPLKMVSILDWLFVPFVKREKICLYFSPISADVLSDLTVRRNKKGTNVLVPRLSRPSPAAITCDNQVATYVILFLKSVLVLSIYALIHVSNSDPNSVLKVPEDRTTLGWV